LTNFAFGFSSFALSEITAGATAAGIPAEIYFAFKYWSVASATFGVCEGTDGSGNLVIANCAQSLAFTPPTVTLVPQADYTLTPLAYLGPGGSGPTTLVPPDLQYTSPQDPIAIQLNANTGEVVALAPPTGQTNSQATITVTETSTGLTANYTINVNSLPTLAVTANPTGVPFAGGDVTITATLAPPAGAIPQSPTPTGTVQLMPAWRLVLSPFHLCPVPLPLHTAAIRYIQLIKVLSMLRLRSRLGPVCHSRTRLRAR
jgi:hypothetical protein